jgi:hypothetical protein
MSGRDESTASNRAAKNAKILCQVALARRAAGPDLGPSFGPSLGPGAARRPTPRVHSSPAEQTSARAERSAARVSNPIVEDSLVSPSGHEEIRLAHWLIPEHGTLVLQPARPLSSNDLKAMKLIVEPWLLVHGALRGLVIQARPFSDWESLAALPHQIPLRRGYRGPVCRAALVADRPPPSLVSGLARHPEVATVTRFDHAQLERALDWARRSDAHPYAEQIDPGLGAPHPPPPNKR